jgi:serine/threonine-protein kinase
LGRPTKEKALEITRQLCLGLAAAHEAGVIHRDLKPANIMIGGRGKVRIMDFGIAGFEQDIDEDRKLAGTPAYMAPELFRGQAPSVRTDIYALGLVLYEVYTGRKAYEAKELGRIQNLHETATPTTPSSLVADGLR